MEYIKVSKAAEKWGISMRRVRVLCAEGKIDGVIRKGNLYMIPATAAKPMDGRKGRTGLLLDIEKKRDLLSAKRPCLLTNRASAKRIRHSAACRRT